MIVVIAPDHGGGHVCRRRTLVDSRCSPDPVLPPLPLTTYLVIVEVKDGAFKHGVSEDDMGHAARHAIRAVDLDGDSKTLLIGADTSGRLLEIVVADLDTDRARIIHAMGLRPSFYRFL